MSASLDARARAPVRLAAGGDGTRRDPVGPARGLDARRRLAPPVRGASRPAPAPSQPGRGRQPPLYALRDPAGGRRRAGVHPSGRGRLTRAPFAGYLTRLTRSRTMSGEPGGLRRILGGAFRAV